MLPARQMSLTPNGSPFQQRKHLNPPRLLDLFCGAGGAAMGYHRAGFEVIGVDIKPQPHYPFEFHQEDALTVLRSGRSWFRLMGFDAIHASPPCQRFIGTGMIDRSKYPDLLTPARPLLEASGQPWIIENVPGAPMRPDAVLCGSAFGLRVRRHRWFEASWPLNPFTLACDHSQPAVGVYGHPRGNAKWGRGRADEWPAAMGIDWMTTEELSQAIPPAYTEWIGRQLAGYVASRLDAQRAG